MTRPHMGLLLALVLVLSGCQSLPGTGPSSRSMTLTGPPATLKASYQINWLGSPHSLQADLEGFSTKPAFLGNASSGMGEALAVTIVVNDPAAGGELRFRHQLLHGPEGRLVSASLVCTRANGSGCVAAETRPLVIPDAWGAPGYLGLGPFLGSTLAFGSTVRTTLWDPRGTVEVAWSVGWAPPRDNRACGWLSAAKPATQKTTLLLAPTWGRILACEDVPLPVRVELGPLTLDLMSSTGDGTLAPKALPEPVVPAPRAECALVFPRRGPDTLPVADYVLWARNRDPYVRDWFRSHPEGAALPGFGKLLQLSDKPLATWEVEALVGLHDPASGQLEARSARETWERTPVQQTSAMQPSTARVDQVQVPPSPPLSCVGDPIDVEALAIGAARRTGFSLYSYTAIAAPEAGAEWQGTPKTMLPFIFMGEGWRDLVPSPWPPRLYLEMSPFEPAQGIEVAQSGVVTLASAALDPATGWIRWTEMHGDTWPWG